MEVRSVVGEVYVGFWQEGTVATHRKSLCERYQHLPMRPALSCAARANPARYERHRPEETTLYRVVQAHLDTYLAFVDIENGGAGLPTFVTDEFDAFLACGILAHGFLRLACDGCKEGKLVAFSCKRRGFCPSCSTRRMAEAAAHLIDHVIPKVPVCQWVLSFLIPLRSLFAVHPELLAPVLQIIHRSIATFLFKQTGIKRDQAATGAVTLIQRFGSAANVRYTENSSTPVTDSNWPNPDCRQKSDC